MRIARVLWIAYPGGKMLALYSRLEAYRYGSDWL